jgi:deoxyribodipyrimidine photolyase
MQKREIMATIVRNSLRLNMNSLIDRDDCKLLLDQSHLIGNPFRGIEEKNFLFDKYKKDSFKTFSDLSDTKISAEQTENRYGDILEGRYESKFNPLLGLKHNNYLLDESFEIFLKPKMSFSFFRKKAEPLAFSCTHEDFNQSNEASKYLTDYFLHDYASSYFKTRNKLHGDHFSTGFSKHLNLGQLHPFEIVRAVSQYEKKSGSNKSTYWIKVELLWREYFYWLYVEHGSDFFRSQGLSGGSLDLNNIELSHYLEQTNSNPLIKAMNNQLMSEGTLSNRSRQIYASFVVNCTDLDWRHGAWFFQLFLIDYDLFSNWGNWLYLSGWGTDSRGPRFFNIVKQMKSYDPELSYLEKYNPGVINPWEAIKND